MKGEGERETVRRDEGRGCEGEQGRMRRISHSKDGR
jgi:hypothetical protein